MVVLVPFLWPLAEHFNAMAHEGAHAVVGGAMGFTLEGVRLEQRCQRRHRLGPGTPETGMRRTLTRFVGYLGPSAFGLFAAKLIETGRVVTVLWIAVLLLVLLLFTIRKSFGIVSVSACHRRAGRHHALCAHAGRRDRQLRNDLAAAAGGRPRRRRRRRADHDVARPDLGVAQRDGDLVPATSTRSLPVRMNRPWLYMG